MRRVSRHHGLIWFGEGAEQWSITDPHSEKLHDACRRLRPEWLYASETPELSESERQLRADLYVVLRCVEDYRHLTTYELGIEHIIKKLRMIWRALRQEEKEENNVDHG